MLIFYKLQVLLSSILALSVSTVALTGNWTEIPGPANAALESITVSTNYLWGIDTRTGVGLTDGDNNVIYCRRPCSDAGSWMDAGGQLDQTIDASETEVWGVNDRGQIYKRPINGSGGWLQISGGRNADCHGKCFSDASVSNNGYIWAISNENETYMLCSRTGITSQCANDDQLLIDDELSLVHIEAGDEEVWAVNANNRIFKRPVKGSGEWSNVPGEMRYISASGNHVWGIAPNDSLYVCEKSCTGDWQYVGGSFKQIDGDNNSSVIGVTTNNTLIAMSLQGTGVSETEKATDTTVIILPTWTLWASTTFASILSKTPLVLATGAPSTTVTVTVHQSSETPDSVKENTSSGTLPTTITVYQSTPDQSSETPESAKTSTSPGVLIGVVAGMVAFSIALLLLVPLSIVVIAALYARKLRKVRDRRRAVVITQYGLGSTEMLHGERNRCDNTVLSDPVYATIEDTFTKPLSQDKHLPSSSMHPERKPVTATQYRSCTDFSYLDEDIDKNIAYASIVTSSEFEVNPAYITFSGSEFDCPTNVHNIRIQRRHSYPH